MFKFMVTGIAGVCLVLFGLVAIGNQIGLRTHEAEIEQVRHAVQNTSAMESEDVLGQAVSWNQYIAASRRYNTMPVLQWIVPNRWDSIPYIEMPERP